MNSYVRRARDGDPLAIESLIKNLRPRISKMANYYGRCCGEDADDLLQEAWIGLLEALPNLDMHIGSPEQYLIAHARWRLLDAIKRAKVRRCTTLEDETVDQVSPSAMESAVADACVSEFADRLKTTQREVLDCLLAGLTWRETGQILGCASANVAYHVRQIRRQYEKWLNEPACLI